MKTESKEIVKREPAGPLDMQSWTALKEQAGVLVKSKFLPTAIDTAEKAIAIALASRELGVGMMEGFRSINVIQGKPTISPQLMLAMANRTGEVQDIEIKATEDKCVVTISRRGRKPYTNEFGVKEATALGLIGKDNYKKQAKTMFQWRALAANLRVTFPDVMLGLYTPEELGAHVRVGDDGETMEVVSPPADAKHIESGPRKITENEGRELYELAKAKGLLGKAFMEFLGVAKLGDVTTDQIEGIKAKIAAYVQVKAEDVAKAYDTEVEAFVRAGVRMDDLGDYIESLPFATDMAAVAAHLKAIRTSANKKEDLVKAIASRPKSEAVTK